MSKYSRAPDERATSLAYNVLQSRQGLGTVAAARAGQARQAKGRRDKTLACRDCSEGMEMDNALHVEGIGAPTKDIPEDG